MDRVSEGGCQCGALRYRVEGKPVALAVCHCKDCQRASGSAFGMSLIVRRDSFRLLSGEPKSFTKTADSGNQVGCYFCGDCGTRIYHSPSVMPDTLNVKPGTLDDPSWLTPDVHVWTKRKHAWVLIPDGVPSLEGQPQQQ